MAINEQEFKLLKLKYSIAEYGFWFLFILFYVLVPLGYLYFRYFLPVANPTAQVSSIFVFMLFIGYLIFNKQLKELIVKMEPSLLKSIITVIPKILPLLLVVGVLSIAEIKLDFVGVLRHIFTNIFVSSFIGVVFYVLHDQYSQKKKALIAQYKTTKAVEANNDTLLSEIEKKNQALFDKINNLIIK